MWQIAMRGTEHEILRAARFLAALGDIEDAVLLGLTEEDARTINRLHRLYYSGCSYPDLANLASLASLIELAKRTGISPHELRLMGINIGDFDPEINPRDAGMSDRDE